MSANVLKAVWGTQNGYVFVPCRLPSKDPTVKDKWSEGKAYKYPEQWAEIKARVIKAASNGYDTYWCPLVFDKPQRLKENVKPKQAVLWADLDPIDPTSLGDLRPSIAWKSSDERYQALWLLSGEYPIESVEQVNKALSYHIGADKGGWDVTQVLRVPASPNYKYDPPQKGSLLWAEARKFDLDSVENLTGNKQVQETPSVEVTDLEALLIGWKIPPRTMSLLHVDPREVVVGDRSDRLWEIETSLLEAGVPVTTLTNIIRLCPWNKFKGRKNEKDQIYKEVLKADEYVKRKVIAPQTEPVISQEEDEKWAIPFDKFAIMDIDKPEWLVEGIWQKGTYGMIAGEPKTYKSVMATDLALSVASGKAFMNTFPVKSIGAVIYIQEENNISTVQDRVFKVAAAKGMLTSTMTGWALPDNLPVYFSNNCGINLTNADSRELIEKTIKEIKPVLVILDPLYMMMGGVDENSATEVGGILKWLTYLRNEYDVSVLLCHHYNKGTGTTRGGQKVRGTSAFHAWVESALYVKTSDELYTVKLEREFRAFPSMPELKFKIDLGMPGELYYDPQLIEEEETKPMSMKVEDICTLLKAMPHTIEELQTLSKYSRQDVTDIVKTLILASKVIKLDGGGKGKHTTYVLV